MIAAIVAPAGDRSIAKTRDCLVLGLERFGFDATPPFVDFDGSCGREAAANGLVAFSVLDVSGGFAAEVSPRVRADARFFADFAIRDPPIGFAAMPHDRSPTSAMQPAGQDLGVPTAPEAGIITALFAAECQSFLSGLSPKRHRIAAQAGLRYRSICPNV
jgi:hypothetical protein